MKFSTSSFRLGMYVLGLIALALFSIPAQAQSGSRTEVGYASFYEGGGKTASGARFNQKAMTAAHRTLPFGTVVLVTNHMNRRSVVVTINDRGPFIRKRVVDLARGAADVIRLPDFGVAKVTVTVLELPPWKASKNI